VTDQDSTRNPEKFRAFYESPPENTATRNGSKTLLTKLSSGMKYHPEIQEVFAGNRPNCPP